MQSFKFLPYETIRANAKKLADELIEQAKKDETKKTKIEPQVQTINRFIRSLNLLIKQQQDNTELSKEYDLHIAAINERLDQLDVIHPLDNEQKKEKKDLSRHKESIANILNNNMDAPTQIAREDQIRLLETKAAELLTGAVLAMKAEIEYANSGIYEKLGYKATDSKFYVGSDSIIGITAENPMDAKSAAQALKAYNTFKSFTSFNKEQLINKDIQVKELDTKKKEIADADIRAKVSVNDHFKRSLGGHLKPTASKPVNKDEPLNLDRHAPLTLEDNEQSINAKHLLTVKRDKKWFEQWTARSNDPKLSQQQRSAIKDLLADFTPASELGANPALKPHPKLNPDTSRYVRDEKSANSYNLMLTKIVPQLKAGINAVPGVEGRADIVVEGAVKGKTPALNVDNKALNQENEQVLARAKVHNAEIRATEKLKAQNIISSKPKKTEEEKLESFVESKWKNLNRIGLKAQVEQAHNNPTYKDENGKDAPQFKHAEPSVKQLKNFPPFDCDKTSKPIAAKDEKNLYKNGLFGKGDPIKYGKEVPNPVKPPVVDSAPVENQTPENEAPRMGMN